MRFALLLSLVLSLGLIDSARAIPGCPNWDGTSFAPANATMDITACPTSCGGTGELLAPWQICDASCPVPACQGTYPTRTASCPCPAYGSANWLTMNAAQQAACCGTPPTVPGAGACTSFGPALWANHVCGIAGCTPSQVPVTAPAGTTFDKLTNKMAACCGRGWVEDNAGGQKLDCLEAVAPTGAGVTAGSFATFYNFGAAPDNLKTAGLTYPNQLFLLDSKGIPINGFYEQTGKRCNYLNTATGLTQNLSSSDQLDILRAALTNQAIPVAGGLHNTRVDQYCCNIVLVALERKCPGADNINGVNVATTDPVTGVRRCTAAQSMKMDFALYDLCDPNVVKRNRFRMATSFTGEPASQASLFPNNVVDVTSIIGDFYPPPLPSLPPVCPASVAVRTIPWTAGKCALINSFPSPASPPCNSWAAAVAASQSCGTQASYSGCQAGTENFCGCTCLSPTNYTMSW